MHKLGLAAALILAALLTGCGNGAADSLTTSGTIAATEVSVAAEIAGKVTDVLVEEGQKVDKGDPVARLDTAALELQLKLAQAALQAAEARLAEARVGPRAEQVRQVEQASREAAANLAGIQKNYNAVKSLYDHGGASKAQLDAVTAQLEAAAARARAARAQADLVREGATAQQLQQLEAVVAQARAAADLAKLNLDRAVIKAPIRGVVLRRLEEPGSLVAPGTPVATLANLDDIWLRVYVPENQLNRVVRGMAVQVGVDAYPGRSFKAEVVRISDQAEFTPRNVQTREERATTVYAVKLQLREGLGGELKPGMPADVTFPPDGR